MKIGLRKLLGYLEKALNSNNIEQLVRLYKTFNGARYDYIGEQPYEALYRAGMVLSRSKYADIANEYFIIVAHGSRSEETAIKSINGIVRLVSSVPPREIVYGLGEIAAYSILSSVRSKAIDSIEKISSHDPFQSLVELGRIFDDTDDNKTLSKAAETAAKILKKKNVMLEIKNDLPKVGGILAGMTDAPDCDPEIKEVIYGQIIRIAAIVHEEAPGLAKQVLEAVGGSKSESKRRYATNVMEKMAPPRPGRYSDYVLSERPKAAGIEIE